MKTVFTDISQVAHLWANQLQDHARNSGNYYFNGEAIYSYGSHFMIAKHHTNKKGKKVVLFTTRTYSSTTSVQVGVTRAACSHKDLIYCYNPDGVSHNENFNHWVSDLESSAKKLLTARKPEKYLNEIASSFNEAKIYAEYFGLKLPKELITLSKIGTKEEYAKLADKQAALARKEAKQRDLRLRQQHDESLAKWRSFELSRLPIHDGKDYLRYDIVKSRIQTSQNVEIPLQTAKEFYSYILATISTGGCTVCNKKLLEFDVIEINKEFVRVGCHNVSMTEINTIAKLLNW